MMKNICISECFYCLYKKRTEQTENLLAEYERKYILLKDIAYIIPQKGWIYELCTFCFL